MQQNNGNPPRHIMSLFTRANYKFSSLVSGRSSTFYFSDPVGNRGRYRRQHQRGPELVFQGRCKRIFISPELEAKISVLAELVTASDNDVAFNTTRYEKITAIYPILQRGDPSGIYRERASLTPKAGWRLFDTNDVLVHFSAGQILLNDNDAATFFAQNGDAVLSGYSGPWTIW
ncbi:MAG: hypothetical protein WAW42_16735 [Candidatus Competibacteraceae bacterium]